MTKNDFEAICALIDEETDISLLKKIKDIVTENIVKLDDVQKNPYWDILLLELNDFIINEVKSKEKKNFKAAPLIIAVRKIRNIDKNYEVCVYDVVGISQDVLIKQKGVGINTLQILESKLNKYELSLNENLNIDNRNSLNRQRKLKGKRS